MDIDAEYTRRQSSGENLLLLNNLKIMFNIVKFGYVISRRPTWIDHLDEEDVAFIKRLVLASGSLKDLAAAYDISYPTVRLRLDRLIAKVKALDDGRRMSVFERTLRGYFAEGKIDASTLKTLLSAHERELEAARETTADPAGDADADDKRPGDPRIGRRAGGA